MRIAIKIIMLLIIIGTAFFFMNKNIKKDDADFITYEVDFKTDKIKLYWKNDSGQILKSINNLKKITETKKENLVFATNAGMYKIDNSPQGLFIQNANMMNSTDTSKGVGNFYLQPNGIFYINKDESVFIKTTANFKMNNNIEYATQSGPMLIIENEINSIFNKNSTNLNIRNGVGITADNKVIFAVSKKEISFYNFANYFKTLGCKNALYLDGFVSRTYYPEKKWIQIDGNFGVMIGVTRK